MGRLRTKGRTARRGVHMKKVASYVDVGRMPDTYGAQPVNQRFLACVKIGSGGKYNRSYIGDVHRNRHTACASGKNPRAALAAALRKAASHTTRRSGAFAGMR